MAILRSRHISEVVQNLWSRSMKSCISMGVVACAASISVAQAGPKIEFGEDAWLSIGAGLRTSITLTEDGAPNGTSDSTDFNVENIRLYLNGQVSKNIGLTFNTERVDGDVDVLDAIARLEFNEHFNIWLGRLLTPADRIELNGPFYALTWNQYTQPLFPSDQGGQAGRIGRDEGIVAWGAFDKFQYAVGLFDGLSGFSNQSDEVLFAGRVAYNFLNKEDNPGYYTSSTYYGGLGNIFTVGLSYQSQSDGVGNVAEAGDFNGLTLDVLSENVFSGGGVFTVEAEYKEFDSDFTVATPPASVSATDACFCLFDGDSYFVSAAYLFPTKVGIGQFQPYVRFVENNPSDAASNDLVEIGTNYVIKGHNARLNINYSSGDANASGFAGNDVDTLLFGVQIQI